MIQAPNTQTIQYPQMLEAVSKIFPYESLRQQVHSIFDAIFNETNIESITYQKETDAYSERGFVEKITITLDKEYILKGRITTLITPSIGIKLPKVLEMQLDEDEGVFDIEHGLVNFSREKAPIELFPAKNFGDIKEKPGSENEYCELEWGEFANRINYGSGVLISLHHTNQLSYCGKFGHSAGGSMNRSYLSERLDSFQKEQAPNL